MLLSIIALTTGFYNLQANVAQEMFLLGNEALHHNISLVISLVVNNSPPENSLPLKEDYFLTFFTNVQIMSITTGEVTGFKLEKASRALEKPSFELKKSNFKLPQLETLLFQLKTQLSQFETRLSQLKYQDSEYQPHHVFKTLLKASNTIQMSRLNIVWRGSIDCVNVNRSIVCRQGRHGLVGLYLHLRTFTIVLEPFSRCAAYQANVWPT